MSEAEQNWEINALKRETKRLNERLRSLELDIEPQGCISQGFDRLSQDIDELQREVRDFQGQTHSSLRSPIPANEYSVSLTRSDVGDDDASPGSP